jgi:gluconate 2-dehydrogenase gamma chain
MDSNDLPNRSRRLFFAKSGATTALAAVAPLAGCAVAPAGPGASAKAPRHAFLTREEALAVEAIVDTFVPKDDVGPGAVELGVVGFIDRRLAGSYGVHATLFMAGPFASGTPQQGEQSSLVPRDTWRLGLADLQAHCLRNLGNRRFEALSAAERDAVLHQVRDGKIAFPSIPARAFLSQAFNDTMDGYFSDPIHGGNAGMGSWKMVGFPGPFRNYSEDIERYRDRKFADAPRGIADLT